MLLSSIKALQSLILNAWPRMGVYKTEILKCVTLPWIRMQEESGDGDEFAEIKAECKLTEQMLRDALGTDAGDFDNEIEQLVKADSRLEGLFSD